jgi:hypothetical protein
VALMTATNTKNADYHIKRISNKWNEAVVSILETAAFVKDAYDEIDNKDKFNQLWMHQDSPFRLSTAIKLLNIANKDILSKIKSNLPATWTTIYFISTLADDDIKRLVDENALCSDTTRKEIEEHLKDATTSPTSKKNLAPALFDFGSIKIPENFDLSKLDGFELEIYQIVRKYGLSLEEDTSKSGIVRLKKQKRTNEINKWIERRLKTHNKGKDIALWDIADRKMFQSAAGQLFDTGETIPDSETGEFHITDIRNQDNPYYGWTKKDFYDFARANMIVTDWCKIEEIDKELYIQQLLAQYMNPDAEAFERSDSKKKLKVRASRVGNQQSRASAVSALEEIATYES